MGLFLRLLEQFGGLLFRGTPLPKMENVDLWGRVHGQACIQSGWKVKVPSGELVS